jgi:hypothetical protein
MNDKESFNGTFKSHEAVPQTEAFEITHRKCAMGQYSYISKTHDSFIL